jgi:hypothetical protein
MSLRGRTRQIPLVLCVAKLQPKSSSLLIFTEGLADATEATASVA